VPGGHREKVSVIAGISLSPRVQRPGLYFQTYPDRHITSVETAAFLRDLLKHLRGRVIVVWDNGPMHKGAPIRQVLTDYPRLRVEWLPPYAPDLNPVEQLWNHVKYGQLANFTPADVVVLDEAVTNVLCEAKYDRQRLQSCYDNTPLTVTNRTGFF
jgi:putative transposase